MNRAFLCGVVLLVGLSSATPAHAQFRNQGIQFNVGWLGLGSTWDGLIGTAWNIHDQPTIGAGHVLALGYNLWFDNTVAIGGSAVRISNLDVIEPIFSLSISTGLRYTFLDERFRPFIDANIHYLQIISVTPSPPIPTNSLLGASPFWVGMRAGGGAEYIFGDEMSIMASVDLAGFVGLNNPPCFGKIQEDGDCSEKVSGQSFILPAAVGRIAYIVYF